MTGKELIAEVTTSLKQYEESGLIDQKTLRLALKNALKTFGTNIMVLNEQVIDIDNAEAMLPEDFWSLEVAIKCDINGYKIVQGSRHNITTDFYTQKIESTYEWDNQANSHTQSDYKEVIHRQYFQNDTAIDFRYGGFMPLRLTRGIKKENLSKNCKNALLNFKSDYEINIVNSKIQTNFKKGYVYMQYNALPTNERGELEIPDDSNLVNYLTYLLKRVTLENIWMNGDDPDLINKIQYNLRMEKDYESRARTSVKFEALGQDWAKKLKISMRKSTNVFERMFPNL